MNVGAEYLFAPHFSVGGEVFYYYSWLATLNSAGSVATSDHESYTGTRVILRFYF